jgi:hypothetical protein
MVPRLRLRLLRHLLLRRRRSQADRHRHEQDRRPGRHRERHERQDRHEIHHLFLRPVRNERGVDRGGLRGG